MTFTITNVSGIAGKTWTVTINGKAVTYTTLASDTNALVAAALQALLAASTIPEFQEVTWTQATNVITGTATNPGQPFTATSSTNDTATGAITGATNASPIVITSTAHGLTTGDVVVNASVGGNTAANGTFTIIVTGANTFSLTGPTGNGAYTSGGTWTKTGENTAATTTASSGPNDLSTAANYTGGALPTGSDTLYFKGNTSAFWGLDALAAVAPTIIYDDDWTGAVGLPDWNVNGYYEYRTKNLQCVSTSVTNRSQGTRVFMDFLTTASVTFNQPSCGNPGSGDLFATRIKGTGASSVLNAQQGSIGLATGAGETTTFGTINTGDVNSPASDVLLFAGTGLAWTTVNQNGGDFTLQSNGTTWKQIAGSGLLRGSATVTTITTNPGYIFKDQSSGTKTTVNITGTVDASQRPISRTYTNVTLYAGGKILDPAGSIIFTNGINLGTGVGIEDVTLILGKGRNYAVT